MTTHAYQTLFVTGTDTGVGKTLVSSALLRRSRLAGISACGFKPVASGCERTPAGWRNEDALALQSESMPVPGYADVNPVALPDAVAPHLAAVHAGVSIDCAVLDAAYETLAARYPRVLIEGAGGWRVPLSETQSFDGWVAVHQWPVLLVVGMRLGCINHALLSAESIARRTTLAGWVANCLPPEQPLLHDNIEALRMRMPAPLWGIVPAGADVTRAAAALDRVWSFSAPAASA